MSGRVVSEPVTVHECAPGWTTYTTGPEAQPFGAGTWAHPPDAYCFPKGTVWECECGKAWVSTGPPAANCPGMTDFRPERRGERRRRERRAVGRALIIEKP